VFYCSCIVASGEVFEVAFVLIDQPLCKFIALKFPYIKKNPQQQHNGKDHGHRLHPLLIVSLTKTLLPKQMLLLYQCFR